MYKIKDLRSQLIYGFITLMILVLIIGLWQFAYMNGWVSRLVLPAPNSVIGALIHGFENGGWSKHALVTVFESLLAFIIGVAMALIIGAFFAYIKWLRVSCYPFVLVAQTFPKIAIAPLLLTWLGYGYSSKVIIGAMLAFFPVFVNTIAGLNAVQQGQLDLLRSMRASAWQEFKYLRLPRSLTYIFASLTVAIVGALLGVIVGEFVGAREGLGYLIIQLSTIGNISGVYAVLLVLSCIAMLAYGILYMFQHLVIRFMGGKQAI